MMPRTFIFFSRLEPEKGIDILIEVIHILDRVGFWSQHRILICGAGSREEYLHTSLSPLGMKQIPEISNDCEAVGIFFLGKRQLSRMPEILRQCDVHIMPSCFLETFGLSALEMASFSIPTLGFMKGGLSQFLLPELSLLDSTERASSIASLMQRIVLQDEYYFADLKHRTHTIADRYTSRHFLDIFGGVFPTKKRVLFIADYVSIIGGLEKTTSMFIRTLSESGISTRLLGAPGESQWLRLKNMMMSVGNIFGAKKIGQEINEYRPDLVWIQSMHRVWGFLGVHIVLQHGISAVAMHHDFGIITPFSQDVEAIADIPKTWSLIDFYRCLKRPTLGKKIFLFYKFILLSLYRTQIRQIKEHFVPSEFMIEPFSRLLGISRDRFRVMPLFTEGASHTE